MARYWIDTTRAALAAYSEVDSLFRGADIAFPYVASTEPTQRILVQARFCDFGACCTSSDNAEADKATLESAGFTVIDEASARALALAWYPVHSPAIVTQPTGGSYSSGASVTLTVVDDGTATEWRWYLGGTAIEGATSSTYAFTMSALMAGSYYVVVSNDVGSVQSNTASVTTQPAITEQPETVSGYWEDVKSMTVSATGGQLEYQWQRSSDNVTFADISGATASTLAFASLSPSDDGYYRCIVSNSAGSVTSEAVTATCVVHPFETYMGSYDRYDQRTDLVAELDGFYIGDVIGEGTHHKDDVFAWAKGVTIRGSAGFSNYAYYYVGCYGASNCSLLLENSTIYLGCFYINAYNDDTVNSNNNAVVVKNSIVYHRVGETMIGCFNNTGTPEALTATLTLSGGTVWYNGYNHVRVGGYAGADSCYPKDCHFIVIGSGTAFLGDYGWTGTRYSTPLSLFTLADSTGNSVDLLNSGLIRVGHVESGQASHAITTDSINDSSDAVQMAFRFGGGYLAYYGDCTDPDSESTMHWSLKTETDNYQILPTGIVQVRDSDGTWRAGTSSDFTVTYCTTDAEGLAATGGLYDGLAGYTVITAGASI